MKEVLNPSESLSVDSKVHDFVEQYVVIYLVEGLCKVQVDNVHIVALLKQIYYVVVVG